MGIAIHLIRDFERQDTGKKKRKRGDGERVHRHRRFLCCSTKRTQKKRKKENKPIHINKINRFKSKKYNQTTRINPAFIL